MTDRPDVTRMLSGLTEKRLNNQCSFWAAEVEFDKNTQDEIRIDYMGYKHRPVRCVTRSSSVELGKFSCYEIKSCMADYKSGHGLNFIGDENYLVTTKEVAEQLRGELIAHRVTILVPDASESKLIAFFKPPHDPYMARMRPASEMLWQMVIARNNKVVKS